MGLQTPSAPWVLSLAPSLVTLCSVQWMTVNIHFCICQALSEPLRRQLYQAPVSKHNKIIEEDLPNLQKEIPMNIQKAYKIQIVWTRQVVPLIK